MTGSSEGDSSGVYDLATVAYDASNGEEVWVDRYEQGFGSQDPGEAAGVGTALALSHDGSRLFVTGQSTDHFGSLVVVAYDAATGDRLWVRQLRGTQGGPSNIGYSIDIDERNRLVYAAGSLERAEGGTDTVVAAYRASSGRRLWVSRYHGKTMSSVEAVSEVIVAPRGDAVYAIGSSGGRTSSDDEDVDAVAIAYDSATGGRIWTDRFESRDDATDLAIAARLSPDGHRLYTINNVSDSIVAIAYDSSNGKRSWFHRYAPDGMVAGASDMTLSPDGKNIYVSGTILRDDPQDWCAGGAHCDYLTLAYDSGNGRLAWSEREAIPDNPASGGSSVDVTPDGKKVYVTGTMSQPPAAGYLSIGYLAGSGEEVWRGGYGETSDRSDESSSSSAVMTGAAIDAEGDHLYVTGISSACGSEVVGVWYMSCALEYGTVSFRL